MLQKVFVRFLTLNFFIIVSVIAQDVTDIVLVLDLVRLAVIVVVIDLAPGLGLVPGHQEEKGDKFLPLAFYTSTLNENFYFFSICLIHRTCIC